MRFMHFGGEEALTEGRHALKIVLRHYIKQPDLTVGKLIASGNLHEVAYATGNGGNKIYVFKDTPLVIVITASAYKKSYAHKQAKQIMLSYILPAVLN